MNLLQAKVYMNLKKMYLNVKNNIIIKDFTFLGSLHNI